MGRRGGRKGPQGRAQDRVRGRVRGGAKRGGGSGRKRGGFNMGGIDAGDIRDYAGRLTDRSGGSSGLAGAAAGLAGGGLAGRFLGGSEGSDEDLERQVAEQFAVVEERLQLLEDQVRELREILGGAAGGTDSGGNP